MSHNIEIRIYYEDTDAGGIVYHANYLKFCERGRTEFLRFLGFENTSMLDRHGVIFVVRHISADYIKTAFLDDLLRVETAIREVKNTSVVMRQTIYRDQEQIFSKDVTIVCVHKEKGKAAALPVEVKKAFEDYRNV